MRICRRRLRFVTLEMSVSFSKYTYMIRTRKTYKGSVLVFSLLVLFLLLSLTLSAVMLVIFSKGSSRSTEKSILAFQVADGAAENMLRFLYDYNNTNDEDLDAFARRLYGTNVNGTGKPTCFNGVISGKLPDSSGTYAVTFLDSDDIELTCSGYANDWCEWRFKLAHMIANGTYAGVTRAVDVSVQLPPQGLCP